MADVGELDGAIVIRVPQVRSIPSGRPGSTRPRTHIVLAFLGKKEIEEILCA